jgi:phosphoglycerate dehydrogenase-like enzyme
MIAPRPDALVVEAVRSGGAPVATDPLDAEAIVWLDPKSPEGLSTVLAESRHVRWVQLPFAGVERFVGAGVLDPRIMWTCAKRAYGEPVAEHALALALAALRDLPQRSRAHRWGRQSGTSLFDQRVTIIGGGGIATDLVSLLAPFRARVSVVRRHVEPMTGVERVVGDDGLDAALDDAKVVVVAAALTPATKGLLNEARLTRIGPDGVLVNVARGELVVTDDLVAVLRDGRLGFAALDVTDPEPLPETHPLWAIDTCLITPHTANTAEMAAPLFAALVRENVERFVAGVPLVGVVDLNEGY